ncbi:MAG: hypothetical protein GF344_19120 [Chitinivibrionales bacterium]|nr:hypothetical protein [Chitinivibrionales bacterium]MBD3358737.1 hypothetical protein [Chitinivibrionales bacterium]
MRLMKRIAGSTLTIAAIAILAARPEAALHTEAFESNDVLSAACGCEPDAKWLQSMLEDISAAESVEQARKKALAPTRAARTALARTRWLVPWSEDIRDAHSRLKECEKRIEDAADTDAVRREFNNMVQLASAGRVDAYLNQADVQIDDDDAGGCDYSTGEIIAIVIGFILGIIPGIILLFVLC